MSRILASALCIFVVFATNMASAWAFQDKSGFGITPPTGFTAEQTSRKQFDVSVGVASATGKPSIAGNGRHQCEAGFKFSEKNNALTKAEINAFMRKPEWTNMARSTLETVFKIHTSTPFTLQGYRGAEFEMEPKSGPDAANTRMMMSIVETPKGRMTTICLTHLPEFSGAKKAFRAIRQSMTLPE